MGNDRLMKPELEYDICVALVEASADPKPQLLNCHNFRQRFRFRQPNYAKGP